LSDSDNDDDTLAVFETPRENEFDLDHIVIGDAKENGNEEDDILLNIPIFLISGSRPSAVRRTSLCSCRVSSFIRVALHCFQLHRHHCLFVLLTPVRLVPGILFRIHLVRVCPD
jgi:hypothetical protein